jgi:predicted nucleic acid-binding protein
MGLVLDASATMAFFYVDERTPPIERLFDDVTKHGVVVPGMWHLEVANSFQMGVRRGRISAAIRDRALTYLADLAIEVDGETSSRAWSDTTRLAAFHGLTVYDAAYLELAQRRRLPLATLDADLAKAARDAGVALRL